MTDILSKTIAELATALDERRVSAREVVDAAIDRHERLDEELRAYSLWAPEATRKTADASIYARRHISRILTSFIWQAAGPG